MAKFNSDEKKHKAENIDGYLIEKVWKYQVELFGQQAKAVREINQCVIDLKEKLNTLEIKFARVQSTVDQLHKADAIQKIHDLETKLVELTSPLNTRQGFIYQIIFILLASLVAGVIGFYFGK